jgi:hypothetical protein
MVLSGEQNNGNFNYPMGDTRVKEHAGVRGNRHTEVLGMTSAAILTHMSVSICRVTLDDDSFDPHKYDVDRLLN